MVTLCNYLYSTHSAPWFATWGIKSVKKHNTWLQCNIYEIHIRKIRRVKVKSEKLVQVSSWSMRATDSAFWVGAIIRPSWLWSSTRRIVGYGLCLIGWMADKADSTYHISAQMGLEKCTYCGNYCVHILYEIGLDRGPWRLNCCLAYDRVLLLQGSHRIVCNPTY